MRLKRLDCCRSAIVVLVTITVYTDSFSQVKIGDNPTILNTNSLLELESTNKGLLIPRMALTETTNASPLTNHISGMIIYNIASQNDVIPGFYYNDGSKWVKLLGNGQINTPTILGTSPTNTLAITGLEIGNLTTDEVVTINPITGVLKKVPISSYNREEQLVAIAIEGQTQFQTPLPITDIDKISVFRNGARIGATLVNASTIKLEEGVSCINGDEIRIVQMN